MGWILSGARLIQVAGCCERGDELTGSIKCGEGGGNSLTGCENFRIPRKGYTDVRRLTLDGGTF